MKVQSQVDNSVAHGTAKAASPIRVCMHILETARTDPRVMHEATALVEAGFEVSIVDIESDRTRPLEEEIRGVRVRHIVKPSWFDSTHFKPWFLVKAAEMLIRGTFRLLLVPADIYHAHNETGFGASYIAARLRRKPLIFDAHEIPFSDKSVTRWHRLHAIAVGLLAHMVPYCAGVITVSDPIAREIHKLYHGPEATLIRNVPRYQTIQKSDRLRQRLGLGPGSHIALYQGVLRPERELDRLIRAARYLEPNVVIVMMGSGPEEASLESLIASEGVADRVKILPPVPYDELLDWTASADLGLIIYSPDYALHVRLCLPNKLFEYLMAGLPVLSSQLNAVGEIVKTYQIGQIAPSLAPTDIAHAINTMLADPIALGCMRRNALEVAQHEFYWEKESERLTRLYREILLGTIG